jgi:signal transduction histidine kinase
MLKQPIEFITDTGIGIPENRLNTILIILSKHLMQRPDCMENRIRLAIVKQLVELQGGKLFVKVY